MVKLFYSFCKFFFEQHKSKIKSDILPYSASLSLSCYLSGIVNEYLRNKYSIEDVYHQARLARILRAGEYDKKTNQPLLWSYKYEQYANTRQNQKTAFFYHPYKF